MTTLPASPALIPANAPLAELQAVRDGWLAQARAERIPERLFDTAYWLGIRDPDSRGDFRCLTIGNLIVWTGVKITTRNIGADAWNMQRRVTVFSGDNVLMRWEWSYVAQDVSDAPGDLRECGELLYIPGSWTAAALALAPKAEAARLAYASAAEERERAEMAKRLLVGREI